MLGVEPDIVGWDVGGVHTKAVLVREGRILGSGFKPYEVQHAPGLLPELLRDLAAEVGARAGTRHAVTMTAELSQQFRTKRDGVAWVLDGFRAAFGETDVFVAGVDGIWRTLDEARVAWRSVAAANWAVTARLIGRRHRDVLLIDIGSTTTDLIPIIDGAPTTLGLDDPGRLAADELLYCGAVRTPVESLVSHVPYARTMAGVSAEGFALTGDVHVWRGMLHPDAYDTATPDGRPATRDFCGERLARILCADRTMLDDAALDAIALSIADAQSQRVTSAVRRMLTRHPTLRHAIVVGLGAWMGRDAARAAGLEVLPAADLLGDQHLIAPAASAALLLAGAA